MGGGGGVNQCTFSGARSERAVKRVFQCVFIVLRPFIQWNGKRHWCFLNFTSVFTGKERLLFNKNNKTIYPQCFDNNNTNKFKIYFLITPLFRFFTRFLFLVFRFTFGCLLGSFWLRDCVLFWTVFNTIGLILRIGIRDPS